MRAVIRSRNDFYRFVDEVSNQLGEQYEKPYTVTVKRFHRPRTNDQNAKAHAMIRELALHCGYTEAAMKDVLKTEFGPIQVFQVGTRIVDAPKGTSDYTVEELSAFIEQLYQIGAEINCAFTEP